MKKYFTIEESFEAIKNEKISLELKKEFDSCCIFNHEEKELTCDITLSKKFHFGFIEYLILLEFYKDYKINVFGSFLLNHCNLNSIDVKFGKVSSDFDCRANNLTSLKNCPEEVGGDDGIGKFDCSYNKLVSLEYCPKNVYDCFFICNDNSKKFTKEEIKLVTRETKSINLKEHEHCGGNFYYVVNKKDNDEYLESDSSKPRTFGKKFKTENTAFKYANKVNTEENPYEVETPEGDVYGKENGEWIVVFS